MPAAACGGWRGRCRHPLADWWGQRAAAACLAALAATSAVTGDAHAAQLPAASAPQYDVSLVGGGLRSEAYAEAAARRAAARHAAQALGRPGDAAAAAPSLVSATTLPLFDRDTYTDAAWAAVNVIGEYALFVDGLADAEGAPGCEQCEANRATLERVWQTVSREFYSPSGELDQAAWAAQLGATLRAAGGTLPTRASLHAAAAAMVATLGDPYTAFLPPSAYRAALRRPQAAERDYLAAQYGGGAGLVLGEGRGAGAGPGLAVAGVLAESAAEGAGVRPGDRLLEIDYYAADRLAAADARALLRGPEGSALTLTVVPRGGGPAREVDLERAALPQPPVKAATLETPKGRHVRYVRLHWFGADATAALAAALDAGRQAGVDGYVLDVRNNPGGVFEEAVRSASLLLPRGAPVVATAGGGPGGAALAAGSVEAEVGDVLGRSVDASPPLTTPPLALLADAGSASAAEVFAGALRDDGRAVLLGERTFGKGLVQYYFPVNDEGAGVKITVAKYLTPRGHDVAAERGLAPDVPCAGGGPGPGPPAPGRDACLAAALDVLDRRAGV